MNWFKQLINWGKTFFYDKSSAMYNYSYTTMAYTFQQVCALPQAVGVIANHRDMRTLASHLARIAGEDIIPLALATYGSALINAYGQDYLKDNEDDLRVGTYTSLQMALYLLQATTWIYKTRKQTQLIIRTVVVILEAPGLVNLHRRQPHFSVCNDAQCSKMRFIQGSLRDQVTYWSTEAAISLIEFIPIIGSPLSSGLFIYHRGRYVLTVVLPDVCNRHQVIYLLENSELAMSIGVIHQVSSWMIGKTIESYTGIPSEYYLYGAMQLILVGQLMCVANLKLPIPKQNSNRCLYDPVLLYQNVIGFGFDVITLGLKYKLEKKLNQSQRAELKHKLLNLPWARLRDLSKEIHHNPFVRVLLPTLLHNFKSFTADPIINPNWEELHRNFITVLNAIIELNESYLFLCYNSVPNITSILAKKIYGAPESLTKTILTLITDKELIDLIKTLKNHIEEFKVSQDLSLREEEDTIVIERRNLGPNLRHRFHQRQEITITGEDDGWSIISAQTGP